MIDDMILLGRGRRIIPLPRQDWERQLAQVPQHQNDRLGFMTRDHHRVRYFVVMALPGAGKPLAPEVIARSLGLPLAQVQAILDDLEKQLFFLVRDAQGNVTWAFPVTVERTPHRLCFDSGERLYAA